MDTLPDLRVTIAESMTALADAQAKRNHASRLRKRGELLRAGAETLRWCAAREAPTVEELEAALDAAETALEEGEGTVLDLVANVRFAVSKWEHGDECPAGQLEARGDAVCDCALIERRQSVLDAVS